MKAIAEGSGVVVRGRPLPKRALRRLFDTSFHEKVYKDLTLRMNNQDVVKDKTLFMTSEQNKNKKSQHHYFYNLVYLLLYQLVIVVTDTGPGLF